MTHLPMNVMREDFETRQMAIFELTAAYDNQKGFVRRNRDEWYIVEDGQDIPMDEFSIRKLDLTVNQSPPFSIDFVTSNLNFP